MSFVRAMVFVTFLPMSIFTQSTAIAQSDEQVERWQNAIKYDTGGSYKCGTRRNFPIKWLIPGPKLYMSDEVAGNAVTHDELARVVDHFNYVVANNSPAKPKITLLPRSANSQATMEYGNGVNEIYFLDEVEIGEGLYGRVRGNRASSATTAFHSTCYYREIDIQIRRFSPAGPLFWSSYEYGAGFSGPTRHIGLVLLHEFGHFFSLKHDAQVSRTMNNSYPQGGTIGSAYQAELFGKDRSEIWAIYKHTDQSTDLAASAWQRHPLSRLNPPQASPYTSVPMEIRDEGRSSLWQVSGGEKIIFPYAVHNLGTTLHYGVPIRFYMSDDVHLGSSDDHLFESLTVNFTGADFTERGQDIHGEFTFTVPNNRTGEFYFGYVVGPVSSDINPNNNSVRFVNRVLVSPNPDIAPGDDNGPSAGNNTTNTIYCQSASSDPDGDGWGWENEQSCVVPHGNTTTNGCDYSSAHLNNGWGWNPTSLTSCPPV